MVYAKFITRVDREGRPVRYGPYYYKSVRMPDGRVKNIYLGTNNSGKIKRIKEMLARITAI